MTFDEAIRKFEKEHPESIVSTIAKYGDGIIISPMSRKTHEEPIGIYYYFDADGNGWYTGLSAKNSYRLTQESKVVNKGAEPTLIKLALEAEKRYATQDERIKYIKEKAPDFLLAYFETQDGEFFLREYTGMGL